MPQPTIVIAESWEAFNWWCGKNGVSNRNRREAIPLIEATDRYRLYGRNCRGSRTVIVGWPDVHAQEVFREELQKFGIEVGIKVRSERASSADHT